MVRLSMVSLLTAFVFFGGANAWAQATNTAMANSNDPSGADGSNIVICSMAVRRILSEIVVSPIGSKSIKLEIGGGENFCNAEGWDWDLSATSANLQAADFVEAETCPAYKSQIAKLHPTHPPTARHSNVLGRVRAGRFVITDRHDLFNLHGRAGRRVAARWMLKTLVAVRPCWDNLREDQTHFVVDRLYANLGISAR